MMNAVVSAHVNAKAEDVRDLYVDPQNWSTIFSETIKAAQIVRRDPEATIISVEHTEGRVTNVLRAVSSTRIELHESKRRYDATFVNDFLPEGDGMRYVLTGSVSLTWPYRLAEPILRPLARARMLRYVVRPLKRAAEGRRSLDGTVCR